MAKASLAQITHYCDRLLRTAAITDYDGAVNGLQVENRGTVTRIAAAVDATAVTVQLAIAAKADLLLVHHGLFWSPRQPWTGRDYALLRSLLENDLAVYSSHLPLDVHPKLGNNAQLCAALGLSGSRARERAGRSANSRSRLRPFFECKGQLIGIEARTRLPRAELARRLERALGGPVKLAPGGPAICRRIGVVTGGAGNELRQVADAGLDTFITGEGAHWTFGLAEELGLNLLYGGHYASETFGVKALAAQLARKFDVPWGFLDHPTGL
jgi:dinuclear metal center YbgI/SA1388 family protein